MTCGGSRTAGFDAALVGESVITAADRTAAVRALALTPHPLPHGGRGAEEESGSPPVSGGVGGG